MTSVSVLVGSTGVVVAKAKLGTRVLLCIGMPASRHSRGREPDVFDPTFELEKTLTFIERGSK